MTDSTFPPGRSQPEILDSHPDDDLYAPLLAPEALETLRARLRSLVGRLWAR